MIAKPGTFRGWMVGLSNKEAKEFTVNGIVEIIRWIRTEQQLGFEKLYGTWLGPIDPSTKNFCMTNSIHFSNLNEKQGKLSDKAFAKSLMGKDYRVLCCRYNSQSSTIRDYMGIAINKEIKRFHGAIDKANNDQDKLQAIVEFIKNCIRIHPFGDANHRVFALALLNFLLTKYSLGFCALTHRRIFFVYGLSESVAMVKDNLTVMPKNTRVQNFCAELIADIQNYELSSEEPAKAVEPAKAAEPARPESEPTKAAEPARAIEPGFRFSRIRTFIASVAYDPTKNRVNLPSRQANSSLSQTQFNDIQTLISRLNGEINGIRSLVMQPENKQRKWLKIDALNTVIGLANKGEALSAVVTAVKTNFNQVMDGETLRLINSLIGEPTVKIYSTIQK
jgi:hypothetical protein